MTGPSKHEPYPDGGSGPFNREPHAKLELGGYAFDPRCSYCNELQEAAWEAYAESRWEEERAAKHTHGLASCAHHHDNDSNYHEHEVTWGEEDEPDPDDGPELPDHLMERYLEETGGVWT